MINYINAPNFVIKAMRRIELGISFFKRKSEKIEFTENEKSLRIIPASESVHQFAICLNGRQNNNSSVKYFSSKDKEETYDINIKGFKSFYIERLSAIGKDKIIALIV